MPPISIAFAGTSAFAIPSLQALLRDAAFRVDLVVTQPDKPAGRARVLTAPPVKLIAEEHGITIWQPKNINAEFPHFQSATFNFPFLIVVSYGQILSEQVLSWPAVTPVNLHASLLPRWRGASPIQHAILAGDAETGVTVQRMDRELDAGPILAQAATTVAPRETFGTLHDRLSTMGAELLVATLKRPLQPVAQDPSKVTLCRKLTRADGVVNLATMTAEEIDRKVRALNPWPGVTLAIGGQTLKLIETHLEPKPESQTLPCKDGTILHLVTVQPPGKTPMSGTAWTRGVR